MFNLRAPDGRWNGWFLRICAKSAGALQVSEAGVHRPHVAGIHGREDDGAYSIVLSGGYEDDQV